MSSDPSTTKVSTTKALGSAIQVARTAAGLRQADAALLCGVGVRFLSELENGKETVRLGVALKVIDGLGLALTLAPKKPFWTGNGGNA